jgi:hypothetical protein
MGTLKYSIMKKKKNNKDFAMNSFQDNETCKAPVTLTFDLVTTKSIGVTN